MSGFKAVLVHFFQKPKMCLGPNYSITDFLPVGAFLARTHKQCPKVGKLFFLKINSKKEST